MPNFTILAKMQQALNIKFDIKTISSENSFDCSDLTPVFVKGGFWVYRNAEPNYEKSVQLPEQEPKLPYYSQVG